MDNIICIFSLIIVPTLICILSLAIVSKKCSVFIFRYTEYCPLEMCSQEECFPKKLPNRILPHEGKIVLIRYNCNQKILSHTSICIIPVTYKDKVHGVFYEVYIYDFTLIYNKTKISETWETQHCICFNKMECIFENTLLLGKLNFQIFGKVPLPLPKSYICNQIWYTVNVHVSAITTKIKYFIDLYCH